MLVGKASVSSGADHGIEVFVGLSLSTLLLFATLVTDALKELVKFLFAELEAHAGAFKKEVCSLDASRVHWIKDLVSFFHGDATLLELGPKLAQKRVLVVHRRLEFQNSSSGKSVEYAEEVHLLNSRLETLHLSGAS